MAQSKPVKIKDKQELAQPNIMTIIDKMADKPEINIDVVERLLDMQERISKKHAEMAFNRALSEMQLELPVIKKRGIATIKNFKNPYAKFEDINEVIKPYLNQFGFSVSFKTKQDDTHLIVETILSHVEGHSESTTVRLPFDDSGCKNSVQAVGSSISYGKRYGMCALLNITTQNEDDDGYAAATETLTAEQVKQLTKLIKKTKTDEGKFKAHFGIDSIEKLPRGKFEDALFALSKKLNEGEGE